MTEWEKLLRGQVYNDFDDDLFQRRVAAKKRFRAYNRTEDGETELRRSILRELLGSVGENVWIEPDFRCEFGKNITIGDGAVIGAGSVVTRDVPPGVVAVGNPCRVVRKITESDRIGYEPPRGKD